jgi:hypothetical protein
MKLPWNPNLRENEEEYAEWQDNWQSMEYRQIPDASLINPTRYFGSDFDELVAATISLAPEQYVTRLYFPVNECPLCSATTSIDDALPASLHAVFSRMSLGVCVWVHKDCLEHLPLLQELPPFPA